jgi:transcriptional regulator with XRE-family HTH domain
MLKRIRGERAFRAYYERLGEIIAKRRVSLDLSQRELAELTGTTQSAIARLERGGRPPRIDTLLRIANALDCELVVELEPRTKTKRGQS